MMTLCHTLHFYCVMFSVGAQATKGRCLATVAVMHFFHNSENIAPVKSSQPANLRALIDKQQPLSLTIIAKDNLVFN